MEILGIGPLELLFIMLIALIVLGPKDMVKAGRTVGQVLRKVVTSPSWHAVQRTSREIRYLPNRLIREAGLEEVRQQIQSSNQLLKEVASEDDVIDHTDQPDDFSDWITPPAIRQTPPNMLTGESPPNLNVQDKHNQES